MSGVAAPARLVLVVLAVGMAHAAAPEDAAYLHWTAAEAANIGKSMYARGRVGGVFDTRLLKTERSYNYKLAATWLTPDVIRATARLAQLAGRLPDDEAQAIVAEAEAAGETVVMVEIDPREGSGVIPVDWSAFLQPRDAARDSARPAAGVQRPQLRTVRGLAGVLRRNYDYDRFWVVFPLRDLGGKPLLAESTATAELVVRIHDKEGRVQWPVPPSIRERIRQLTTTAPPLGPF